jgi:isopenicillin N synthase-like dioxygenase
MPHVNEPCPYIPTAQLVVIDYDLLLQRDPSSIEQLLEACKSHGFFYLDLSKPSISSTITQWEESLSLMNDWFSKSLEEKLAVSGSDRHGYKPMGTHAGVTHNSKDGWESFRVSILFLFSCRQKTLT